MVELLADRFMESFRAADERRYLVDDDALPASWAHAGWGTLTAAMTGCEPIFQDGMAWCQPNMSWEGVGYLRVNLDHPWIRFSVKCSQALWDRWDEDFFLLPSPHRSPLDAAEGIRGSALYEDMYLAPEKVEGLLDWCVEWTLAVERHFREFASAPDGWGRAAWATYLPNQAIWVNGDPVDLLGPEMSRRFNQPHASKLFASLGGGYFHHHALGLHLATEVSHTESMIVQEVSTDPNCPRPVDVMLNAEEMRENIIEASMRVPIVVTGIHPGELDRLLPIFARGRFILDMRCEDPDALKDVVAKVRKCSNFR
jgi:hypothetical protein